MHSKNNTALETRFTAGFKTTDYQIIMEFFNLCFSEANFLPTVLMILIVGYWMLMIFGVVGMDMFDIDVDVDADLGLDAEVGFDVETEGAMSTAGGSTTTGGDTFLKSLFDFFYLTDIPIVIVGTTFAFGYWVSSLVTNGMFNSGQTFLTSLIWVIPNAIVGIVMMKITLIPMVKILRKSGPDDMSHGDLIGCVGTVKSLKVTEKYGEIVVQQDDGTEVVLNVHCEKGKSLAKGDSAKIISYNIDHGTFLVELTKWENNSDA